MPNPTPDRGLARGPDLGLIRPDGAGSGVECPVLFQDVSWDDYEAMLRIRGHRRFQMTYNRGLMEVRFPGPTEVFEGVSWDDYEAMLRIVGDRHIRLTYARGDLEVRMPSQKHERVAQRLGLLVPMLAEGLEVDYLALGTTTWRRSGAVRGLEADQSYYLGHHDAVFGKDLVDLDVDPPPDLAIEVDITTSILDRLDVYAGLNVPEIWRFDGAKITILHLQGDRYAPRDDSVSFPGLRAEEIDQLLALGATTTMLAWSRSVRTWVSEVLAPRRHQPGPDVVGQE